MRGNLYELKVLVRGRPITEYEHQNRFFIEGRRGSEFELEFKNNSAERVLVVPSVDGVSTLNGLTAGPDSPGFAVAAHATLRIPGWMVDGKNAAKFVFEDRSRAYANYSNGGSTNAGVIGVLVFREEKPKVEVHHHYHEKTIPWVKPDWLRGPIYGASSSGDPLANHPFNVNLGQYTQRMAAERQATLNSANDIDLSRTINNQSTYNIGAAEAAARRVTLTAGTADQVSVASSEPFALGTGWGQKTDFETKQTTFKKGELSAQLVIYYDNRRNLEARGIQVVKNEKKQALDELPSAFPTMGCKPPPGWQG